MPNRLIAAVLACSFTAILAASQSTPPPPQDQQQPPTFRTEANFVRVDVFATLKGAPLKDLTVNDFEVLEDGVRQTVSTFEFVQVRAGIPQELRNEPNTIQESR